MMKWSMIFMLTVSCLCSSHAVEKINIEKPCEIVFVISLTRGMEYEDFRHSFRLSYDPVMNVVREFPTYVQVSDTGVRVAVITFAIKSTVQLDLTGDEKQIRNLATPDTLEQAYYNRADLAFEEALRVLEQSRPNAAKFVCLITDGSTLAIPPLSEKVEATADKLWKSGASIFAGVVAESWYSHANVKNFIDNKIARGVSRVLPYKNIRQFFEKIKEQLPQLLFCENAEKICSFDRFGKCMTSWWSVMDRNLNCDDQSKRPKVPCDESECEKICNRWPWRKIECNDVNSGTVEIGRGPKPPERQALYAFCPMKKTTVCPPRRTTTTKRTTTTTKRATTTTKRTTTAKPIRPPPPKKTLKPDEGPDVTVSVMGFSSDRAGSTAGAGGLEGVPEQSKSSFWGWAIALIVLIVLLLLLLLLVAVLVSRRRRRVAKERHQGKPRHGISPRSSSQGHRSGPKTAVSSGARGGLQIPTKGGKGRQSGSSSGPSGPPLALTSGGGQPSRSGSRDSRPPHYLSHGPRSSGQPSGPSFDVAYERARNVKKADKSAGVSLPSIQPKKQSHGQSPSRPGVSASSMKQRGQSQSRANVSASSTQQKKQSRGQSPSRGTVPGPSFQKSYDRGPKGKKADKSAGVSLESSVGKKKGGKTRK